MVYGVGYGNVGQGSTIVKCLEFNSIYKSRNDNFG